MRNMKARNFGLRSSKMDTALKNAMQEKGMSFKSVSTNMTHIKSFVVHVKDLGVHRLEKITKEHVVSFSEHLKERYEQGEISAATAQNALSAVNSAMSQARLDSNLRVEGVRQAGLQTRSHIAQHDKSMDQARHDELKNLIGDRFSAQLELQRELGLRFKESCLINAKQVLANAERTGKATIEFGTKGGLTRTIPITRESQLSALREAARIQDQDRSMIPANESFREYRAKSNALMTKHKFHFHSERHTFANDRYEALIGAKSPVRSGFKHGKAHIEYLSQHRGISFEAAKNLDREVRMQIAKELGHSRIDVTNSYLG